MERFTIAQGNAGEAPERRADPFTSLEEAQSGGASPVGGSPPDPQVPAIAKRRSFSVAEIEEHLAALDKLGHGERGAYMRQHGLYSSQVAGWRHKRSVALAVKRGPKARERNPLAKVVAEKDRRISELERRLKRAELMLDIQKKAQEVLATFPAKEFGSGESA